MIVAKESPYAQGGGFAGEAPSRPARPRILFLQPISGINTYEFQSRRSRQTYPMAAGPKRQSGWKTARHSDCFFSRLYSRFRAGLAEEGLEAVRKVAKKSPEAFVAIAARICPNDVRLALEQAIPGGMSLEGYSLMREVIAAIREGLPEADQMQPDQVFQHVLEALHDCSKKEQNTNSSICSGQIRK
jgi:hypothetical protein